MLDKVIFHLKPVPVAHLEHPDNARIPEVDAHCRPIDGQGPLHSPWLQHYRQPHNVQLRGKWILPCELPRELGIPVQWLFVPANPSTHLRSLRFMRLRRGEMDLRSGFGAIASDDTISKDGI